MPVPARRSRENTRARLLEAAVKVFVKKGFSFSRIDDVVAEAGFTRGAFYSNFDSMDELFIESVKLLAKQSLEVAREAIAVETNLLDRTVIVRVLERLRPMGLDMFLLSSEMTMYALRHPESRKEAVHLRRQLTLQFEHFLEEIFKRMGVSPQTDTYTIADSLMVLFFDSVVKDHLNPTGGNSADLLQSTIDNLLAGLSQK
ncbi:TetR/AcrR family transcriptional regulator [Boudabousia marimammalium]|uniref:HTH tetR-type domain-containing protein n=1 Tax=Boudabousia marimammalium TaxID=156892 RepID=A0A1Q5PRR6_9ACTO|nr:TetR/AcrR family transcriptional regulator [Boudabousia marimammalium]OKL50277.1 hypothetical protein BM477_02495 [Boudabousia marimammalium]